MAIKTRSLTIARGRVHGPEGKNSTPKQPHDMLRPFAQAILRMMMKAIFSEIMPADAAC